MKYMKTVEVDVPHNPAPAEEPLEVLEQRVARHLLELADRLALQRDPAAAVRCVDAYLALRGLNH